ncbi:MAG: hypothetical protein K2X87_34845 [Gemmataceae bacterium]|nr:hypothetical protein [Gemmataceae bacterium]
MTTERKLRAGVLAGLVGLTAAGGGCSHFDNTEKGVGLGALAGAGVGTAIGAATGNPKTGAVVGGLLGAGAGGAIGNSMDRADQQKREERQTAVAVAQASAQANQRLLGLNEVVQMVQEGQDEQVIINQIRSSGSTFQLSPGDLSFLKTNNVPPRVVIEMQNARPAPVVYDRRPRTVVVREAPTVVYQEPAYIYGPPPPVFVGGYYHRRW